MKDLEKRPLLAGDASTEKPVVYFVRWYLLLVTSFLALSQGLIWNTFGPIAPAVKPLLHWGDGAVALTANWGPICYVLAFLPSSYLLSIKGLRASCLTMTFLMTIGCLMRCFTTSPGPAKYLMHGGAILNGIAGPVAMCAGPTLSVTWFPLHERTTATAIVALANYVGVALSFLVGPQLVPAHRSRSETDANLLLYMRGTAAFVGLTFLMTLSYYPNKPKNPPTVSAAETRTDFIQGLKELAKHKVFWLVCSSYGILTGIYGGWAAFLSPNLQDVLSEERDPEDLASWLGFYATIAGCVAGLLLARLADFFAGRLKPFILFMGFFSCAAFLWFALICTNVAPSGNLSMYTSNVLGGIAINSVIPLYYELGVEVTYPIDEGVTTCALTTMNNIFALIFLFIPMVISSNAWVNWCLVGGCIGSALILLPTKIVYKRLHVDIKKVYEVNVQ